MSQTPPETTRTTAASARDTGPRYPDWLRETVREQSEFIERLNPFPFEQPADIRGYLSLHQNDYLRLSDHPDVVSARAEANARPRIESFSSSVFGGASREHDEFVDLLKLSLQADDVLLTTAGWTANVGLIEAIAHPDVPIYVDGEAHASLMDGIRLSGGRRVIVQHNDPANLAKRIRIHGPGIVCIDAMYSTDGTIPDLEQCLEICESNDCTLVLDEAHSFGMYGERGGGIAVEAGLASRVHFRTISLSKALGGHGGVVAGGLSMMRSLRMRMRSVLFSSATASILAAGHGAALRILMADPRRALHCLAMAELFRQNMKRNKIDTAGSAGQILSLYFKDEYACEFYGRLRQRGILTSVFVYPAVPKGVSLARFSFYSELQAADIEYLSEVVVTELSEMKRLGMGVLS